MGRLIEARGVDIRELLESGTVDFPDSGPPAIDLRASWSDAALAVASWSAAAERLAGRQHLLVSATLEGFVEGLVGEDRSTIRAAADRLDEHVRAIAASGALCCVLHPPAVTAEVSYRDAYNAAHRALQFLAESAEALGIVVALRAPWRGALLSPLELRHLLDAQASASVATCVDVASLRGIGRLDDWMATLGPRVAAIRFDRSLRAEEKDQLSPPPNQDRLLIYDVAAIRS